MYNTILLSVKKINVKMKKTLAPALYFHPFLIFFFFSDSPLQGRLLKFTPPSLKKGANYAL